MSSRHRAAIAALRSSSTASSAVPGAVAQKCIAQVRFARESPSIRLTYNATENDHKMSRYLVEKMEGVITAMNPTHYEVHNRPKNFTIVPYQSTHCTGGTIMGTDPKSSVVNRYLQAWNAHNLFVQGASVFPQQPGYNPTGTLGALAYWSAKAITEEYLKNPGPLVHA